MVLNPARAGRLLLFSFLAAVMLVSCVPQKKIRYLQREQEKDTVAYNPARGKAGYRLQVKDNLYIRVYTLDDRAVQFFNKAGGTSTYNDYANDASVYLNSYTVDPAGEIDFPVIGRVAVKGFTAEEVRNSLQGRISEYLKEVTVVVKVVNFRVTVVGEVARPGEYLIYQDEMNFFEALSLAGDMTEFANRNKVALIRKTDSGSRVIYLDATSFTVLSSPYYYLQPGDIIYVSPLGYKRWGLGSTFPWALVLASISTTLLLINYFQ